jgi:SAM-dependent methyltransferase
MAVTRSATRYADFLLPHLSAHTDLLDVGCGSGELSVDLARSVGHLTGIDIDADEIVRARQAAARAAVTNATFEVGDIVNLEHASDTFDVVFGHSVLEAMPRPQFALQQMLRVLKPGGLVAVASVEYGGLVLAGPHADLTRRFYTIRENLWAVEGSDPFLGRHLRRLLLDAGFEQVVASAKAISYGTVELVEEFGLGRADDCDNPWYSAAAMDNGLATAEDLASMRRAWRAWAGSPSSYAAFTWCRALGRKPTT